MNGASVGASRMRSSGSSLVGEEVGGAGMDRLTCALVFEGLSYGDPSVASFLSIEARVIHQERSAHAPNSFRLIGPAPRRRLDRRRGGGRSSVVVCRPAHRRMDHA